MTPEELAEEYLKNLAKKRIPFTYLNVNEQIKQAFLAGLKAKTQWHDLRKSPDDLPEEDTTVLLFTEVESVTARYDKKYESFFMMNDKLNYCIFIDPKIYIAWCELPKFEG